jgi:Flp pilus assembly pilin Flp
MMNLFFVTKTWLQARFTRDERGANLVEYILLVALIAIAVVTAVVFMRGELVSKFDYAGSKVSNTPNP